MPGTVSYTHLDVYKRQLLILARDILVQINLRQLRLRMRQHEVIFHQFLQKLHSTCTVGEGMKHLEIDSVFIVSHLK